MFYFNFLEASNSTPYILASNILDGMATPILWVGKFGHIEDKESLSIKEELLDFETFGFETSCLYADNAYNEDRADNTG